MVAQGILPFQLERERESTGLTSLAGLPLYLELAHVAGVWRSVAEQVRTGRDGQGWSDGQMVLALILLVLAGGDCVDDLERLEADDGLRLLMMRVQWHGLPRRERRELERRWRNERTRAFPSPSAARRWLSWFHNDAEERRRIEGRAFIPTPVAALVGLAEVNAELLAFLQRHRPCSVATLDIDATLVETTKSQALYCYKKFRAYQPLNVWWAEQRVVVYSEFRDGNVPAGYQQRRVLEEALDLMPTGVERVQLRSDSAGYEWDLLKYCAEGKHPRFGVIDFAVSADVNDAFRRALVETPELTWRKLSPDADQEWAEVCFVPNEAARTKNGPTYRYLAIREPVRQLELFDDEGEQYPFPTLTSRDDAGRAVPYKLFALVTNRTGDGAAIIRWHRQRCGDSEQAHAVMKHDLSGGKMPSKYFGANAAWWAVMILAMNLDAIMRRLVLGQGWLRRRMKAVRFHFIHLAGRVVQHARQLILRVGGRGHELLRDAREAIARLGGAPSPGPAG